MRFATDYVLSSAHRISNIRLHLIPGRLTHGVLRLVCACDLMTAGAKLPWQVASAVCVRGLQVAVASCDRCMCGIMAGCYRNLRSPYVWGLKYDLLKFSVCQYPS